MTTSKAAPKVEVYDRGERIIVIGTHHPQTARDAIRAHYARLGLSSLGVLSVTPSYGEIRLARRGWVRPEDIDVECRPELVRSRWGLGRVRALVVAV